MEAKYFKLGFFYGGPFGGIHLTALFSIQDGSWLEVIIYDLFYCCESNCLETSSTYTFVAGSTQL